MNAQPGVYNLGFSPHKREHARRRRIIGQGFSDSSMREAEPYIMEHIRNLCDRLLERKEDLQSTSIDPTSQVIAGAWTDPKNMANWGQYDQSPNY
jgi:cytochrome P450